MPIRLLRTVTFKFLNFEWCWLRQLCLCHCFFYGTCY